MITLYELKGAGGRHYSLFSWRTRMALAHKGLAFESKPVLMSDKAAERLGRTLEPLRASLKRQPFVCGAQPAYADYVVFSVFQWARVMSAYKVLAIDDPLAAWRGRLLDLHAGFVRNAAA